MNNFLLNEGYDDLNNLFTSGKGSNIYIKNKMFLDLSLCAGSHLLGHNPLIFQKSFRNMQKLSVSNFAAKISMLLNSPKLLKKFFHNTKNLYFAILELRQ